MLWSFTPIWPFFLSCSGQYFCSASVAFFSDHEQILWIPCSVCILRSLSLDTGFFKLLLKNSDFLFIFKVRLTRHAQPTCAWYSLLNILFYLCFISRIQPSGALLRRMLLKCKWDWFDIASFIILTCTVPLRTRVWSFLFTDEKVFSLFYTQRAYKFLKKKLPIFICSW